MSTLLAALVQLGGCVAETAYEDRDTSNAELGETQQSLYSDVGGVGAFNGVEWQIDAPWRLEPIVDAAGNASYDAIPLVFTMGDASLQLPGPKKLAFNHFCGFQIIELADDLRQSKYTYIPPSGFHEIEGQREWLGTGQPAGDPSDFHQVRRVWAGESPDALLKIDDWAEWNAVALYHPVLPYKPGQDIRLAVYASTSADGSCANFEKPWSGDVMQFLLAVPRAVGSTYLHDFVKVHFGEQPLPRFGADWSYGDLHYHSQGTDNEGEMGTSYRGAIQAMKAMGLDFLFATEHASDSKQLINLQRFSLDNLPSFLPDWVPDSVADWVKQKIIDWVNDAGIAGATPDFGILRDMDAQRFAHLHGWLNASDGVNAQVAQSGGSGRTPQIFLGGEVDAIPELSDDDKNRGGFPYGFNQFYGYNEPCTGVMQEIVDYTDFETKCPGNLLQTTPFPGHWAIRDVQGPFTYDYARQHMVYLPKHHGDTNAFVSSRTGTYGGGGRYFSDIIQKDIRPADKGYVFLAHPVSAEGGQGAGRLGPDIVPYSDLQLQTAFESPEVLGLQLWNEDKRNYSKKGEHSFPMVEQIGDYADTPYVWNFTTNEASGLYKELSQGIAMWDHVLLWGITPARLAKLNPQRTEPRKLFMAGGSDAHGDLNYRREGRFFGWDSANDTAIGKPRNLLFVGTSNGHPAQEQVVAGLASGQFSITDGPALRIVIDVNGNGVIDAGDVPMGGDFKIPGTSAPVLVEWKSTPEFGRVKTVRLYVGVQSGTHEGVVWSTLVPGPGAEGCIKSDSAITDNTGRVYCPVGERYARDLSGTLEFAVPQAQGYQGTRTFNLLPSQFPVFDTKCSTTFETVEVDDGVYKQVPVTECDAIHVEAPQRLYTRAFAETDLGIAASHRFAFTNPIWMQADPPPAAPSLSLTQLSCDSLSRTNTFSASVTAAGGVPATSLSKEFKTNGGWQSLSGSTFTALEGSVVSVRGQACNAHGCSAWAESSLLSPACHPAPPATPNVDVEFISCNKGTKSFLVTVTNGAGGGPVTSLTQEVKIGSTGSWITLNNSIVKASGSATVAARARACGPGGCSDYGSGWDDGGNCKTSGGGGPLPP